MNGQNSQNVAQALTIGAALLNAAMNALQANAQVQTMVAKAQSEGRDTFTDDEWATLDAAQTAADAILAGAQPPAGA